MATPNRGGVGVVLQLSALALRPALNVVCDALGVGFGGRAAEVATQWFLDRFNDPSQRLLTALRKSNQNAWQALEVGLAGESLWRRATSVLGKAEDRAFQRQVRQFLDAAAAADGITVADDEFRRLCLAQLRQARKARLLDAAVDPAALADRVGSFARFTDPQSVADAQWAAIGAMADDLPSPDYDQLGRLLVLRPAGRPLLVEAARYFFRREVESDAQLARMIDAARLERMVEGQEAGFAALADAIATNGGQLEQMLDDVLARLDELKQQGARIEVGVADVRQQGQRTEHGVEQIRLMMVQLLRRSDLLGVALRPRDTGSIRGGDERHEVRQLAAAFDALPDADRRAPDLLNGLGKLHVAAGEFDPALRRFEDVARCAPDPGTEAEACFNAYRAAGERANTEQAAREPGRWDAALAALGRAAAIDPERFAPFPLERYEPVSILGAGGFGTAFLCRDKLIGSRLVIKSLNAAELQHDVNELFREAQLLDSINHPSIIRVRHCDYADRARTRPYLVMDYFDGATLDRHVRVGGALSPGAAIGLAVPLAEALAAAHEQGIFHRDIKPNNILVRSVASNVGADARLEVKLIDFGLALKRDAAAPLPSTAHHSIRDRSIAGTLEYAPPEQMGRLDGVEVGPYSDVYGFAKTLCFALFKTTHQLTRRQWSSLPAALADLLESCIAEQPADRPASFRVVLDRLRAAGAEAPVTTLAPPPPPPPPQPPRRVAPPPLPPRPVPPPPPLRSVVPSSSIPPLPDATEDQPYRAALAAASPMFGDKDHLAAPLPAHPRTLIEECRRLLMLADLTAKPGIGSHLARGYVRLITYGIYDTHKKTRLVRDRFANCLAALERWALFYPQYRADFFDLWTRTRQGLEHPAIAEDYFEQAETARKHGIL